MTKPVVNPSTLPSGAFREITSINVAVNEINRRLENLNQAITSHPR